MNSLTLDKYFSKFSSNEIVNICEPLSKNFDIDYFLYLRIYSDGSRFFLATHNDFIKWVLKKGYFVSGGIQYVEPGIYFIKQLSNAVPVREAKKIDSQIKGAFNYFNIDFLENGINLIFKLDGYCEIFEFAAAPKDKSLVNFYVNNIDILNHFTLYFKDKAKNLIKSAHNNRIAFQSQKLFLHIATDQAQHLNKYNFYNDAKIDSIQINDKYLKTSLSSREIVCLIYLTVGYTAKETAKSLNISPKTVEAYIASVKQKLNCTKKSEIVRKFLKVSMFSADYLASFF